MDAKKTYRMTRQRQVILEAVRSSKGHPTADEIYEKVRKVLPRVSLGTVYRNLDVLSAIGMIRKMEPDHTQMRFDCKTGDHYHMTCVHCGGIQDIPAAESDNPLEILESALGGLTKYGVFGHKLEFVGLCRRCLEKGAEFPREAQPEQSTDPEE